MTRIYLLGRVMIETDVEVIESSALPGRQGRLAFVYLVATPRRIGRSELAELLWPDELPPTWDSSLSAIISKLRKVLDRAEIDGQAALEGFHGSYGFRPPPGTWIDMRHAVNALDEAEGALRRGAPTEAWSNGVVASSILCRPLLAGESGEWLEETRRRLHDMQVRAFDVVAGALLASGQPNSAIVAARRAIELAPYRESSYAMLMECHIAAGNRAEAVRIYGELETLLRETLGVSPTEDVQALFEQALG